MPADYSLSLEQLFKKLPTLPTDRLILRPLTLEDAEDVYAYASDPMVARWVLWHQHSSLSDSVMYVKSVLRKYANGDCAEWGLELKESGRVIGTCGFVNLDTEHRRAEIGYALGQPYWGRGLATEAARATVSFGFRQLNLNRIEARCATLNTPSELVMARIGMRYEGTLRQQLFVKGRFADMKLYAILRADFGI